MPNESDTAAKGVNRRDFLRIGILASLALLTVEAVGAAAVSLWPKTKAAAATNNLVVGKPSDFPVGSVTRFPDGGFFLAHVDAGFLAISQVCTHLGCIVPWKPDEESADNLETKGRFNCPCHGSIFDRYGRVIRAPATRPLDLHPVSLSGGVLAVDVATTIRRQSYQPSQALKV